MQASKYANVMGSTNEANEIAWCLTTNNWKSRYWIGIASNTSNPPFQLYYSLLGSNNIIKSYSPWSYGSKLIHSFFTGNDHISPIPAGALFEDDDDFPNFRRWKYLPASRYLCDLWWTPRNPLPEPNMLAHEKSMVLKRWINSFWDSQFSGRLLFVSGRVSEHGYKSH